ncbi:sugar ABC transporter substrate-binding protein, partial [Shimia thalassica]|nr:sugar ABC transporter substrate-binding protein [Shimia thalassica]
MSPGFEGGAVVDVMAAPSDAPPASLQAILAHPDLVGNGGADGDSGPGAAMAVTEAGRVGDGKFGAVGRSDDMVPYVE